MKKLYLILALLFLAIFPQLTKAESSLDRPSQLPTISLTEATAKIRQKETFYLFIGREDNVDAQLALQQLEEATTQTGQTVYFLDTKGIDSKKYKAFSKKYAIRSSAYLSYFSNRKQGTVYHNNWRAPLVDLTDFLKANA